MIRKLMVVGNWKTHFNVHQSSIHIHRLHKHVQAHRDVEIIIAPSLIALQPLAQEAHRHSFQFAAQNGFYKDEGAYTGEVSFAMLSGLVQYALVGHSERRLYFGETLDIVRQKVASAVHNGITPILLIGETFEERQQGEAKQVIHDQLTTALSDLTAEDVAHMAIAYEPLWAISSFNGIIAKPHDIETVLKHIRNEVRELYGDYAADAVRILYGGSVDDQTVGGYLEIADCDGVVPGSASLNYAKFAGIVESAHRIASARRESHGQ